MMSREARKLDIVAYDIRVEEIGRVSCKAIVGSAQRNTMVAYRVVLAVLHIVEALKTAAQQGMQKAKPTMRRDRPTDVHPGAIVGSVALDGGDDDDQSEQNHHLVEAILAEVAVKNGYRDRPPPVAGQRKTGMRIDEQARRFSIG